MTTRTIGDREMLSRFGYIDRRNQSTLGHEDRLTLAAGSVSSDESCEGCAPTACACGRNSTASSRRSETLRQAQTWEQVKASYLGDGFCEPCSVQAAYGHQIGFSQMTRVCAECAGTTPTWRRAGDEARKWAGVTSEDAGREPIAA